MQTHIRVLAWLHIVLGVMGLIAGTFALLLFGGIAGIVGVAESDPDKFIAIPILGAIGAFVFILAAVLSIPGIIAGWGLLNGRQWARVITIVLSVLELAHVPFGTALGAYGLWVLLQSDSERMLQPGPSLHRYQ
jgi:hypothetical protein